MNMDLFTLTTCACTGNLNNGSHSLHVLGESCLPEASRQPGRAESGSAS
jgi:hypothetical protein